MLMRPLRRSAVDPPSRDVVKLEKEQVREGERSEDRGSSVQGLWLGGA